MKKPTKKTAPKKPARKKIKPIEPATPRAQEPLPTIDVPVFSIIPQPSPVEVREALPQQVGISYAAQGRSCVSCGTIHAEAACPSCGTRIGGDQ